MKTRFFLSIVMLLALKSGFSQTAVTLKINSLLGENPFTLNQEQADSAGNYFAFTRLEYYVSEIQLLHDGGQVTPVTDLYLLVNPALKSDYALGSFPITHLEGIQFSIGVDSLHNHLDPATYPAEHPLAPKDPSMHWGWASGYRFLAVEGISGFSAGNLPDVFQFHTIGDQNYRTVMLPIQRDAVSDQLIIDLNADYLHLLDDIRFWGGVISHSTSGRAAEMLANLASLVFTVSIPTGIAEPVSSGSMQVQPNPVTGVTTLTYSFPPSDDMVLLIFDSYGRMVTTQRLTASEGWTELQMPYPGGIYMAVIQSQNRILGSTRIMVR